MNPIDLIVTVCAVLSPATCEETASGVFLRCFVAAVRHGRAALYRAMGRRTSEMDRDQMALRISAHAAIRRMQEGSSGGLRPAAGTDYLLQSFRSLSAIENTASALISISRTRHCLDRDS